MSNLHKNNVYDYIFLSNEETVLKFKLGISTDDISNVIKNYINKISPYKFTVQSYKDVLKSTKFSPTVLPNLGKLGLKGNLLKTDSYLVPTVKDKPLEFLLSSIYECNILKLKHLNLMLENLESEDTIKQDITKEICSLLDLELVKVYDISDGNLDVIVDDIFEMSSSCSQANILNRLSWILTSSKTNLDLVQELDLTDKFIDAAKNYKSNQKVK